MLIIFASSNHFRLEFSLIIVMIYYNLMTKRSISWIIALKPVASARSMAQVVNSRLLKSSHRSRFQKMKSIFDVWKGERWLLNEITIMPLEFKVHFEKWFRFYWNFFNYLKITQKGPLHFNHSRGLPYRCTALQKKFCNIISLFCFLFLSHSFSLSLLDPLVLFFLSFFFCGRVVL